MKKIIYSKIFIVTSLVVIMTSCSKDFLEVDPYGKAEASTYYSTEIEVMRGLTAAYDLLNGDLNQGWSGLNFIKQLPSDGTNCGGGGSSDQAQYQDIDDFKWTAENAGITSYYNLLYYGVNRCNDLINNVTATQALVPRMVAEAKFLRAYYFFELTIAFGDVPLRLKAALSLSEGLARTPQAEVYAQIEKDLTEAIPDLPNKGDYADEDRFRANKQAAQALLGKAHLYQDDFTAALTQFEAIIAREGNDVGLETNFSEISLEVTEFGVESLFESVYVPDGRDWGNVAWDRSANDNRHIQLSGPRDFSDANGGSIGINGGWGFMPPTQKLYNAFDPADPRRLATVVSSQELIDIYGGTGFNDGWDTEGLIRSKYTTYKSETVGQPEMNYTTDWRLIRYSDVLLMAAEAYYKNSQENEARTQLNKLRTRAGYASPVTESGTDLFAVIKNERFIELAYEGHRFWDLVRWGDAANEITGFVANKHEHFPIPLAEINGNSEISSTDQNPGY